MKTKIEWTVTQHPDGRIFPGYTFNPWWGCTKVSPGCKNCYAETWDTRWGGNHWGPDSERRRFGLKHWNEPLKWNKFAQQLGIRLKVFCASMSDWAEDNDSIIKERERLFELIKATPYLNWLMLTKRMDENIGKKLPSDWMNGLNYKNVWLGTTCENQDQANNRLPWLLTVRASVHFVSGEPLLGSIDFTKIKTNPEVMSRIFGASEKDIDEKNSFFNCLENDSLYFDRLDWIIVGGESGDRARPMHNDWVIKIVDDCKNHRVPIFFKQWGEWGLYNHGEKQSNKVSLLNNGEYSIWDDSIQAFSEKTNSGKIYPADEWNKYHAVVMSRLGKHKTGRDIGWPDKSTPILLNEMPANHDIV